MNFRKYFFIILSILIVFGARAQDNNIALGQWRVHLAYGLNTSLEEFNGKIYVASEINAFTVDINDHSVETLSRTNGLSDVSITKVRANKDKTILMFGYSNGNIDIYKNNTFINISDIKRKDIVGSKKINDIVFWKNYAYVCCDFGVCVVDLDKNEIKETFENLAPTGLGNKVTGCAFSGNGDSIFLATERGLMTAKNHFSVNLMDFSNWYTYGTSSNLTTQMKSVIWFDSKIYTVTKDNILFYKAGNSFIQSSIPCDRFSSFKVYNNKLIIAKQTNVAICKSETDFQVVTPISATGIVDATVDKNNGVWSLDFWIGLYTNSGASDYYSIKPNAPSSNTVFNLSSYNNSILFTNGGYSSSFNFLYRKAEYNIFDNHSWKTYDGDATPMPYCLDLVNGVYNPTTQNFYFASFGYGLLIGNKDNSYTLIDDKNGPFPRMLEEDGPYLFVTYATVDKKGKVWVCNVSTNDSAPILHALNTDGTWASKAFAGISATYPLEVLVDDYDNKWLRIRPDKDGGIIVYNDITNTYRYLSDIKGNGSLANKSVKAMAKDLNGDIWLATDNGICVFYNPKSITTSGEATQPIFDGFPLLYNESISCIEIDGGNRKWIGTQNGVWLLSDDGTEVIQYFTTSNSPLLSNYIIDIEVNDITGEVFIATDKGIISYRGDATAGKSKPDEIKIFPNPVKQGYNGTISISGLSKDAEVKITDIYGTLIYQTIAEGGTAAWKGRNYNGEFAEPGVYLIFSASSDGTSGLVGKIAIE